MGEAVFADEDRHAEAEHADRIRDLGIWTGSSMRTLLAYIRSSSRRIYAESRGDSGSFRHVRAYAEGAANRPSHLRCPFARDQIAGRFGGLLRQRTNFGSQSRKAPPAVAGLGGLAIQGEKVGLKGDLFDDGDNLGRNVGYELIIPCIWEERHSDVERSRGFEGSQGPCARDRRVHSRLAPRGFGRNPKLVSRMTSGIGRCRGLKLSEFGVARRLDGAATLHLERATWI